MPAEIDVSIVLVSWNTRKLLLECLAALPNALGPLEAEVWVVDNASSDDSVGAVRTWAATASLPVHLIENSENVGFAAANNQAIARSTGRYVLLLNTDTLPEPNAIANLVAFADSQPLCGMVGGMLLNPDGSFQGSFAAFPNFVSEVLNASGLGRRLFGAWYPNTGPREAQVARKVDYIQGACMLARREAIDEVGMLDEGYFMYNEEPDWCWRMRQAGWETWYTPDARILHYGGQSTRQVRHAMIQALYRSKVRYIRKHHGTWNARLLQAAFVVLLRLKWLVLLVQALRTSQPILPPIRWNDLNSATTATISLGSSIKHREAKERP